MAQPLFIMRHKWFSACMVPLSSQSSLYIPLVKVGKRTELAGLEHLSLEFSPQKSVLAHLLNECHLNLWLVTQWSEEVLREYLVPLAVIDLHVLGLFLVVIARVKIPLLVFGGLGALKTSLKSAVVSLIPDLKLLILLFLNWLLLFDILNWSFMVYLRHIQILINNSVEVLVGNQLPLSLHCEDFHY